ncbi:SRPBCC family protein [Nocardiopsis suaedae]|uniref:SRPBCC family protein n=1 Tax=Nocardiopsis suaedae TaxID=3018444 RepID=A0ABT4TTY5_9ACTN|nr:SRPBCC family protein [Nocardiopsis suaedae]MDA2807709.1 SRPBCC family protein [Nocardiopsis suaedae]
MTADELTTVDGRPALRMERRLAHPVEEVWRAVTEPERLSRWYPFAVVALELRPGGAMRFDDGEGTVMDGTVVEVDPPRRFSFSEHAPEGMHRETDDLVRIDLEPDGDGCRLVFTHVFDDRPGAASYAVGWDLCLRMLGTVLDGREPDWPTPPQGALEERIDALGLGAGRVEDGPGGPVLTVERQLTRPADEVWAEIAGDRAGNAAGDGVPEGLLVPGVAASGRTEAKPPELFEYAWSADSADAGRVRWELSAGTGHGARLVVTQTGRAADRPLLEAALPAWERRVREVGRRVAGLEG